ncbi:MAG: outer membrane lipoprotein-sorting protein [Planctomycetota bacterium]
MLATNAEQRELDTILTVPGRMAAMSSPFALCAILLLLFVLPHETGQAGEKERPPIPSSGEALTSSTAMAMEKAPDVQEADAAQRPADAIPLLKDGTPDLEAVVRHFEDLYRSRSSIAEVELKVIRPRQERSLGMKTWTQGEDKALVVIRSPPREKGMATLKVDKNLWNYLPRIRRTIRIPPSMMLSPWMGSDFTNDDLVRETSFREDYTYALVGPSEDPRGWLVRFTAKEGVVGLWRQFDLVVSEDATLPLESSWYDRKGRLARTMRWEDVREMGGRRIPSHIVLIPTDQEGHRTEMTYASIEFDVDLPASTFSLTDLERQR